MMENYVFQAVLSSSEEGGYDVEFPDLPGCFTCGDDLHDAAEMAMDAAATYVGALLKDGAAVPKATYKDVEAGEKSMLVAFSTDESYIVDGETVSAAEAARRLAVSPSRITHMLDSGILSGYRCGRRTYVTVKSINARKSVVPKSGRPRKALA